MHQDGTDRDERSTENQRTEDAVEENPVPVLLRNRKEVKDDKEDKKVINGKALLHEVAREELEAALLRQGVGVVARESGIEWEPPESVGIEPGAEKKGEADPDHHVDDGLSVTNLVVVSGTPPHVDKKTPQNQEAEKPVEPPCGLHGKEFGVISGGDHDKS